MRWMWAAFLAVAVAVPSSGCGTVYNLTSSSPDNFGGVQHDLKFAADVSEHGGIMSGVGGDETSRGYIALIALALYGADLSLSFAADVLTLPLASYLRERYEGSADSAAAPAK